MFLLPNRRTDICLVFQETGMPPGYVEVDGSRACYLSLGHTKEAPVQLNLEGSHSPSCSSHLPVSPLLSLLLMTSLPPPFLPRNLHPPQVEIQRGVGAVGSKSRFCHLLVEWLQAEGLLTLGLSFPFC